VRARRQFEEAIPAQAPHYRFTGLDLGFVYERGALVGDGSPKPDVRDPVADYRPTTWPGARLPHLWVEQDGIRRAIHDVVAHPPLTLLVHAEGRLLWRAAIDSMTGVPAGAVRCLAIGTSPDADLVDRDETWRKLSEIEPSGAVLVRPDGHVAWRTRARPDDATRVLAHVVLRVLRV
jgi:2,4-dichlorophenol 6-monooxygenase